LSFSFEGNIYAEDSFVTTSTINNSILTSTTIGNSILDMNSRNITSVMDPILQQDAATKNYVDLLGIRIFSITLSGTNTTALTTNVSGCYHIMIRNQVVNGPSAIFSLTKNETNNYSQIQLINSSPGISSLTQLRLTWPPNSGILLHKTDSNYNGSYNIKINYL
jgi:hypothetical protein